MHGNGKGDPLIRALITIILGTIAFSMLFGLFRGGADMEMGNMGDMGTMGNSGYSIDGLLGGLLGLLINLMLVALVVAAIVAIVLWIKKSFFNNANTKAMQVFNDPLIKTVAVVVGGVFGLVLLFGLFGNYLNIGTGSGMHGYAATGFNTSLSFYGLLNLMIKILAVVLVVSVILALVAYLKKQYEAGAFNSFRSNGADTGGNNGSNESTGPKSGPGTGNQA